jgi:hypothetical protein
MLSNIELCPYEAQQFLSCHFPQCKCNQPQAPPKVQSIYPYDPESCIRSKKWCKHTRFPSDPHLAYSRLLKLSKTQSVETQLLIDIPRTYSHISYFTDSIGKNALIRILHAFSVYSPSLGYVQGMNYIAATLLWHCSEVDAFWFLVVLLEDYELRDNFLAGFPGLKKHHHVMDFLICNHLPSVYSHLLNLNIAVQMFATEWFMTLFTNIVPLDSSHLILGKFFQHGWTFVYRLCLLILNKLAGKIMQAGSFAEVLNLMRPADNTVKQWKRFLKNLERGKTRGVWKKLVREAKGIEINEEFVECMVRNANNMREDDEFIE